MTDIFISYSHQDRDFADQVYRELQRFKVRGFMDNTDVSAGADFSRQVKEAVKNADALLVILSKYAAHSSFVMAEIGLAQSMGKTVLPVLAPGENYELSVPPQLLDRSVIDAGSTPIELVAAKVVAAITNTSVEVSLNEVKSRKVRRQRILIATLIILLSLGGTAVWMANLAFHQKSIAVHEMQLAEEARKEAEEIRNRIEPLTSGSASIALAPDGRSLATGNRDGSIRIWDINTGEALANLEGHSDSISGLTYSPDGQLIASASGDGTVGIWSISKGVQLMTLRGRTDSVISVQFTPDGQFLLTRSLDGTVRQWDVDSGEPVKAPIIEE